MTNHSQRIQLEPAFILHRRAFRNSSFIVELLTVSHGRLSVVARGARSEKSRYRGKLEPFNQRLVNWSGRHELKTLNHVECNGPPLHLHGKKLLCGFYLNELLMRLFHAHDPHPEVFTLYQKTLENIGHDSQLESHLRYFEKRLLQALGYGLSLTKEPETHQPIVAGQHYEYRPDQGFVACCSDHPHQRLFIGKSLLALEKEQLNDAESLADAKRLMRQVLQHYLGTKPLKSRELMM